MSDAAVTIIVAGSLNIATMMFGFLTLWLKLRYASVKAEEAANKADEAVKTVDKKSTMLEEKLDANTSTTEAVNTKTDAIVHQTNGGLDGVRNLLATVAERVAKLEDYNHDNSHRVLEAINAAHLRLTEVATLLKIQFPMLPVKA